MASVIENRHARVGMRNLSTVSFAPPLGRSTSQSALDKVVKRSYGRVRHGLRSTSITHLPPWEYHPEYAGRLIGPVRTSTAFIPSAFFTVTHGIYDDPDRLYDTYSPFTWPYSYQDSRVIRKDPLLQGAQAVEPFYSNRVRSYPASNIRSRGYYAAEVDHFTEDADRATDAYLRWSRGVEMGRASSYRSPYADEGALCRLGAYSPSLLQRYLRAAWK